MSIMSIIPPYFQMFIFFHLLFKVSIPSPNINQPTLGFIFHPVPTPTTPQLVSHSLLCCCSPTALPLPSRRKHRRKPKHSQHTALAIRSVVVVASGRVVCCNVSRPGVVCAYYSKSHPLSYWRLHVISVQLPSGACCDSVLRNQSGSGFELRQRRPRVLVSTRKSDFAQVPGSQRVT